MFCFGKFIYQALVDQVSPTNDIEGYEISPLSVKPFQSHFPIQIHEMDGNVLVFLEVSDNFLEDWLFFGGQAQMFRSGPFWPEHGLDRIGGFHETQDGRYARAAAEASERNGVPILVASELVYTDRDYGNSGPQGVRESGRLCYPSGHRAIRALSHMVRYSEYRQRR